VSGVLLDTHIFLFLTDDVERVPARVRRAIDDAEQRYLSAASVWEMSIKISIGKLRLPETLERFLPSRSAELLTRSLPVTQRHALRAGNLPPIHGDPFDRMLVAQALEEDLVLLTLDPSVASYAVKTLGYDTPRKRQTRKAR
jgi:PIN domain nuclease of toxin-antitoxin system